MDRRMVRVLVVEDDSTLAGMLKTYFEKATNTTIEVVATLQSAISRVKEGGVDVVLLDLGLPDAKGLEGVRTVAKTGIPLVVLTGSGPSLKEEALKSGAADFVEKPAALDILERTVRHAAIAKEVEEAFADVKESMKNTDEAFDQADKSLARLEAIGDIIKENSSLPPDSKRVKG